MSTALRILLLLWCAACARGASDISEQTVEARSGCYVVYVGEPLYWMLPAWSRVDTTTSTRLRLKLETAVDTSGPVRPAFVLTAGPRPVIGSHTWQPTRHGFRIMMYDVDTRAQITVAGNTPLLRGAGFSDGMFEGGMFRYAVVARRVGCDGFILGADAPRK